MCVRPDKKQKLLFILVYAKGLCNEKASGGSKSTVRLLVELSERFNITIIYFKKTKTIDILNKKYGIDTIYANIPLSTWRFNLLVYRIFPQLVINLIKNKFFDYVYTMRGTIPIGNLLKKNSPRVKHCIFARAYEDLEIMKIVPSTEKLSVSRILESFLFKNYYYESYIKSDMVVVNSLFMMTKFKMIFNHLINIQVLYPSIKIDINKEITHRENIQRVGFVNKGASKGVALIIELAECFPTLDFFIYGKKLNVNKYSNIFSMGYVASEYQIYSNLDIMLVPSTWEEPYGRVASESISNGVIPIVSPLGGLPEAAISDLFVAPSLSLYEWSNKLKDVINNLDQYTAEVERARLTLFDIQNKNKHNPLSII